ncbi:hypothetical protein ONE63_009523 [Megalurothrips usitatus]|uniref:Uncharacterized protein n=1 Tax=Megalurothrips usitatus TaxID=439358 RepID=A0AAV7XNZ7_9NEOP|nr:hypothetical protein ONE63_009523 [Megalurothrips usitatus]
MIDQEENRNIVQERGRERERNRSPVQERNWTQHREGSREGIRPLDQVRNRAVSGERNRGFDQEGSRGFDRERSRSFDRARKRSADRERIRDMPWDHGNISRDRSLDRLGRGVSPVRSGGRRQGWIGPRTPSEESFREAGWEQPRSPQRSGGRAGPMGAPTGRPRELSRGREPQERIRDLKEKPSSRPKEPERKDKAQDPNRRRDYIEGKNQEMLPDRDLSGNYKPDRSRKREHEENAGKDRGRGRPRTPERRVPPELRSEKIVKKTPQMLIEEFKEKHLRQTEKPEKFNRREDYLSKQGQGRDGIVQGRGHNQQDSKEWENIRDFQERRSIQPVVGLPFLDEVRRQRERESLSHGQGFQGFQAHQGHQGQQGHVGHAAHASSSGSYHHEDQPAVWQNHSIQQPFKPSEDERRQQSRWGSPGREKLSSHIESHKSAPHTSQSVPKSHHPPSNGKPDDNFWRRNLPSLGESQWNKPRSDLSNSTPRDAGVQRPSSFTKGHQSAKEVIFVRGLARDISEMDIRKDISDCGLWPKDVRVVTDAETGASRGLAFITFNSVDEATRWMDLRGSVLNLRPNNHAAMDYSNPISRDWECIRCHTMNFKYRMNCYQCNRAKEDCLDGWEETCPYPTNALLLRGLNPLSSISDITKSLKSRMLAQTRLDGVKMGVDAKGRPRSVCFVQLTSVTDSMSLHKSLINEPLIIDNCQVTVAYCQLDKLPIMDSHPGKLHPAIPIITPAIPPAIPLNLPSTQQTSQPANNIPVVSRAAPAMPPPPKPVAVTVSTATIRSMLEGNYTEKDIPTLAQYCASAYAKNPQEQAAYIRYYTKHYKDKLHKV